ncbi:MAG TPA: hypothetical protein PKD64_06300 [Pirellulaceae bacterium]|nr:hypothetical protein [Pirellulaceae bacterium]HMO91792.1 hypothetical protein [Pirellulaceae bacterium]HMP69591.1 hypothetical protein [Pirellulaceae bacterium]
MIPDPTAEIKRIRHELGAADGFDVERIFARLRRLEAEFDRTVVRRPPRRIVDNNAVHRSDEAARSEMENLSPPPVDR